MRVERDLEMSETLSSIEQEIIRLVALENWPGFRTGGLEVLRRENTGAGRFTYLRDRHEQFVRDRFYAAQGKYIEMDGVPHGLSFVVVASNGRIDFIEIAVNGVYPWDGTERRWRIA